MQTVAPLPIAGAAGTHPGMLDLLRTAASRHGVVTLDDVRAAGRSRSAWCRAHRAGHLVSIHPGVSRLADAPPSAVQAIAAAVVATGGLASHLSAAYLWGAGVPGADPVDVIVTDRGCSPRRVGVRVHRPTDVADLQPVRRAGIATTSPVRTALDVGAVGAPVTVAAVVEHLVVHRHLRLACLRAGMDRHARRGRRGLGALRLVLDDWVLAETPPDGPLEMAMARLLRHHRLPRAVFHHVVVCDARRVVVGFGLVERRVAIEVEGWARLADRLAVRADRERDTELAGAGWLVLRFTWREVQFEADRVAARIRAALAARPAAGRAGGAGRGA